MTIFSRNVNGDVNDFNKEGTKTIIDVDSNTAWKILSEDTGLSENNSDFIFIDVRTDIEWDQDGIVDLSELRKEPLFISWRNAPDMSINGDFIDCLEKQVTDKNSKLFFLCKRGGRSKEAAEAANSAGYKICYNIVNGYGDINDKIDGKESNSWLNSNLPVRGKK